MNLKITHLSLIFFLTLLFNFFFETTILAQKDNDDITIGKYRNLHSKILNEDRLLLISLPGVTEKRRIPLAVQCGSLV